MAAVEGNTLNANEAHLDSRLAEARDSVRQAETILARAIAAGEGEDAALALRLRDEAKDAERDLLAGKETFAEARKPKPVTPDPLVADYAGRWRAANPWFGSAGQEEDTAIVNVIDSRLTAEGYDPKTDLYWKELTNRVKRRLAPAEEKEEGRPRRTPPPQGQTREHAPQSTRREVFVTPERKQAMIDAGIWDDAPRRNKMLKAYADFDRDQSAGR